MNRALILLLFALPAPLLPQDAPPISLDREPHHHLVLRNEAVRVFTFELPSRDGFPAHRNDADSVAVVLGDATTVTVTPGKADVLEFQKDGQVHFLESTVREVRNIGETTFRGLVITLQHPQTGSRNLCARILPDAPLSCPVAEPPSPEATHEDLPLFETDQLRITSLRLRSRRATTVGRLGHEEMVIGLSQTTAVNGQSAKTLQPGDFMWLGKKDRPRTINNPSDQEGRIIVMEFK